MARSRKNNTLIYVLLAVAAVQLVALGSLLAAGFGSAPAEPPEETPAETARGEAMPQWLIPAPDTPAEPEPEPAPEPVREKAPPADALTAAEILSDARVVAHGLGSVEDVPTLNCREGFEEKYAQGVRVFEADLRLTRDLQVVLRHDWRAGWQEGVSESAVPTLEEFLEKPILEKYTPMSFRDLLLLMEEHPDICVVTDTKFTEAEVVTVQFEAMLADARDLGLSYLFDRMVIQVYDPLMFRVVDSVHHFPHYIYTLYTAGFGRTEDAFREVADFCTENGILGVTLWDYWWREAYAPMAQERGLLVFAHTVNDREQAAGLLDSGVSAVYTDHLVPADLTDPEDEEQDTPAIGSEEGENEHGVD